MTRNYQWQLLHIRFLGLLVALIKIFIVLGSIWQPGTLKLWFLKFLSFTMGNNFLKNSSKRDQKVMKDFYHKF